MRCPRCGADDDKVVDSRSSDDASAIRRRRECLSCHQRFTTFERVEEVPLRIAKRGGGIEAFAPEKVVAGLAAATKGRPIDDDALATLAAQVEDQLRLAGGDVPSEQVGRLVLEGLRELDAVAALRFASVYKGFDDVSDFEHEIAELAKRTDPKRRDADRR